MSRVNKYRALKKESKAYVHGWNGGDQTNYGTKLERTSKSLKRTYKDKTRTTWYGKKIPDYVKKKLSEKAKLRTGSKNSRAKPVICIDTGEVYGCSTEAQEDKGINSFCIRRCCLGKSMTAGGLRWKYACIDEILKGANGNDNRTV